MRACRQALLIAIAAGWLSTAGAAYAGDRFDVPIKQTVTGNTIRYSIPIVVEGKTIDAMLDTGSTGLRILASVMPSSGYKTTQNHETYPFGNGVRISGSIADVDVSLGDNSRDVIIPVSVINSVACDPDVPNCPASKVGDVKDTIADTGFGAILGIDMPSRNLSVPVPNPLPRFATAWG